MLTNRTVIHMTFSRKEALFQHSASHTVNELGVSVSSCDAEHLAVVVDSTVIIDSMIESVRGS